MMHALTPLRLFRPSTLAVGAILLASPVTARAQRADSTAVVALEREWLAAQSDSATLERILAPDFVHQLGSGDAITKRQHVAFVVAHPSPPGVERAFERLEVRLYGTTAIATGIVRASTRAANGSSAPRRTVFTDVFVKRDGRWQAVSAQETPILPPPSR